MPINNDLPEKTFPMKFRWREKPTTEYKQSLENLSVSCLSHPSRGQILSHVATFSLATWEDRPNFGYTTEEHEKALKGILQGSVLPNFMETLKFTFLISNIDLVDVTHLIRHRTFTFSAHCTGDRDQRHDAALVKPSIQEHGEFYARYQELMEEAKALYADMVDSKEISFLDARTVLPRCTENHYYVSASLKDLIPFFKQRLDKQIQPETDNLIAIKMLLHVARVIPEIGYIIDLDEPDWFFIKTAQQDHSSNLYYPEEKNDTFDYNEQWFVYKRKRKDMLGGYVFHEIWSRLAFIYKDIVNTFKEKTNA